MAPFLVRWPAELKSLRGLLKTPGHPKEIGVLEPLLVWNQPCANPKLADQADPKHPTGAASSTELQAVYCRRRGRHHGRFSPVHLACAEPNRRECTGREATWPGTPGRYPVAQAVGTGLGRYVTRSLAFLLGISGRVSEFVRLARGAGPEPAGAESLAGPQLSRRAVAAGTFRVLWAALTRER